MLSEQTRAVLTTTFSDEQVVEQAIRHAEWEVQQGFVTSDHAATAAYRNASCYAGRCGTLSPIPCRKARHGSTAMWWDHGRRAEQRNKPDVGPPSAAAVKVVAAMDSGRRPHVDPAADDGRASLLKQIVEATDPDEQHDLRRRMLALQHKDGVSAPPWLPTPETADRRWVK